MNRKETTQILVILASNYKFFNEQMSQPGKSDVLVKTWESCFEDMPYELVVSAVKKAMLTSEYPPTIAEVRKQATEMINPTKNNALVDWNECYKMICNGLYMTQEEFDKHSEICRKFLGSIAQLRAYATNEDFNMDVVRSNFLKQYESLSKAEREQKLLPKKMQDFIGQLADKMSVKQIGE